MNDIELKLALRKRLLALPHAKKAGDSVILFCPFCCRDTDHGHLYVTIDNNSDMPVLYHCFRCEESGILNGETMRMIGVSDLQMNARLLRYNKHSTRIEKNKVYKTNEISLGIPEGLPERDEWKRQYLCKRLGVDISYEELAQLKIVFSLKDVLTLNNISRVNTNVDTARLLDKDYIGFVTAKNEFIIYRDCTNKNKLRYNKYSLFQSLGDTKKFYTIPNEIDLLTTDDIHVVLAEGTFDILGLYYNVFDKKIKNIAYSAICGCGYTTVINYFIQLGFIGSNVYYHIFSDKDKKLGFYNRVVKETNVLLWSGGLYVHYNTFDGEKDYGVPRDRIRISNHKIKDSK